MKEDMGKIREVTLEDAKAIADIYNIYVKDTDITFETEPVSVEEMRERIATISAHNPYLVYEMEGEIAGYSYVHGWKERAAYQYTVETTVYLSPKYFRKGIGRKLMERLIEECRAYGFRALIACITDGNEVSFILHEKLGFKKVSHFEKVGRKFDRWIDVVDYELLLED